MKNLGMEVVSVVDVSHMDVIVSILKAKDRRKNNMATLTKFQIFLREKGIDTFEYEKIVPDGKAWRKLMDEWHNYKKFKGDK